MLFEDYFVSEDEKARLRYEGMHKYTWLFMSTGDVSDLAYVVRDLMMWPIMIMTVVTLATNRQYDLFWPYVIIDGIYLIRFAFLAIGRWIYFKNNPIEKETEEQWVARIQKKLDELEELEKLEKMQEEQGETEE